MVQSQLWHHIIDLIGVDVHCQKFGGDSHQEVT